MSLTGIKFHSREKWSGKGSGHLKGVVLSRGFTVYRSIFTKFVNLHMECTSRIHIPACVAIPSLDVIETYFLEESLVTIYCVAGASSVHDSFLHVCTSRFTRNVDTMA